MVPCEHAWSCVIYWIKPLNQPSSIIWQYSQVKVFPISFHLSTCIWEHQGLNLGLSECQIWALPFSVIFVSNHSRGVQKTPNHSSSSFLHLLHLARPSNSHIQFGRVSLAMSSVWFSFSRPSSLWRMAGPLFPLQYVELGKLWDSSQGCFPYPREGGVGNLRGKGTGGAGQFMVVGRLRFLFQSITLYPRALDTSEGRCWSRVRLSRVWKL